MTLLKCTGKPHPQSDIFAIHALLLLVSESSWNEIGDLAALWFASIPTSAPWYNMREE